ncbi:conserved exported protein of unknown function [Rhodovastum atsumiense]|uniref:Porin n=1 Tax=Rhodovastum atsumiense TaxID=504468 RepID=A0A5M6ISB3_9PROT|nr:hypothetical protein [Rhodovastum atsumiense]KAA5610365.1 hypothetical protein F1189_19875 [Rhodovastum atsumiense]CAH2600888.1 conserved exported protein of unknown function [Rhodovastum atsumiense]
MRKLLLASVAMLSGTVGLASVASAQLQTQYPYTAPQGSTPVATPGTGTAIQSFTSNPPLASSNVTVRLAGRLTAYFAAGSDSGRNNSSVSGNKLSGYSMWEYARLYPSFDAVAANGLKFGAFLEIRQDNGAAATASPSGSNNSRGALYFRRETGYFGTDQLGFLRFGATDQPTSLFVTGTFENFNDGGWNGDVPNFFTGRTIPGWIAPDVGALYSTTKVVYLSPKFFDVLDFGVSYEPGTGTVGGNSSGQCPVAGTGCDALSSTTSATEAARRRNTLDAVARVRTAVGPFGIAGTVGTIQSGHVQYNGGSSLTDYKGLSVLDAGLQLTYGGLAVGGHIDAGQFNSGYALSPKGAGNSFGWLVGASYAFGPAIVGASFYQFQNPGAWTQTNTSVGQTRNEVGVAVGGTLTVAPGAYLFLSYLYGQRHQAGFDFLNNANGTTNNNVKAQGIALGTQLRW